MADALISPGVGGTFWLISGGFIAYAAKKITSENDHSKTALMGVLGAFVFAAQMINFTIPGTGSSGHIGGGLLLAVLLGPYRAFVTLSSVLVIQSLFFADGGILALGCNIFNLAFFPAFFAYPLIFNKIAGQKITNNKRIAVASVSGALGGLVPGALFVVIQTSASGISELPFSTFLTFMLPIHLAIGLVEGVATWAVLVFALKTHSHPVLTTGKASMSFRFATSFGVLAFLLGVIFSWFASSSPDGLEWSMLKTVGNVELAHTTSGVHHFFTALQEKISFLPDYTFAQPTHTTALAKAGTSVSGLVGSIVVVACAALLGAVLRRRVRVENT